MDRKFARRSAGLSSCNQLAGASVNIRVKDVPSGKPSRRIRINKLYVNSFRNIKIFVYAAI